MGDTTVLRLGSVTSTQDVARDLPIGSIVIAEHQTAGRGRRDHRWDAPPGSALLVSFVLAPKPLLSIAAGVAAAEACGSNVRLKWPNDLVVEDKKVGGILVENMAGKAVCGIGINLHRAPEHAAKLDQPQAWVFKRLREKMTFWSAAPDEEVLARWRELSATLGRRVRVEMSGQTVEGIADDIGPRGELIVDGIPVVTGSLSYP
jgi:BirA family biotin operon repressor/biotin-[acetyl-CoA-carboxylase] ligase